MSDKLGWGIIGTGRIAGVLAGAINDSQTGRLVAVGSRTQASADRFGDEYKIPNRYLTYDAMLADPAVEAVYISLPNDMHAQWAIRCAEAKKHILCEKPVSLNYAEVMPMLEAARYHNVFFLEAFMYRCHPATARLAELLREGAIGEVRVIHANFAYNMGQTLENIRMQNDAGGGGLMDVGCYTLSMARLIAGAAQGKDFAEPTEFKAVAHIGAASRVDEWSTATLKFPGDILANLSCGNQVGMTNSVVIYGSEGIITVPNPWFPGRNRGDSAFIEVVKGADKETIVIKDHEPLYTHEVDVVAQCIKEGKLEAPAPCMTWADTIGNAKGLDRWRQEVALTFDVEDKIAQAAPYNGRPLARRSDIKMRYGKVEGVDKPVSRLVMGTMVIRNDKIPYSFALLDHFFEIGGTAIDTAFVYGGQKSELGVGQWIRNRGVRDDVFLIGKGAGTSTCTPELVTNNMLISLERLGLENVDLYMMHRDNPNVPVGEFVDCLDEHRRAGRIKSFGGSNWTTERLAAANEYARSKGIDGFVGSSPNFSLAVWNEPMWDDCVTASDAASRAWYQETNMPLFAWSSQANGFFTGRFGAADRDNPELAEIVRVWFNDGNFERLKRVEELAARKGVGTTQVALAYVLAQPFNMYALIGPQSIEEIRTSALALEVELTPEEVRWLNLEA